MPPAAPSRSAVRMTGAVLVLLCGLVSCAAFVSGIAVFGKRDVAAGCAVEAPRPSIGGPYWERTRILVAERTLLPLGAVCVLDSPEDAVGPQTVRVQSWPQTVVWIAAGAAALAGLVLLLRPSVVLRR